MKKNITFPIVVSLLVLSGLLFSGCTNQDSAVKTDDSSGFEQKNTTITITGKLTKSGNLYLVTDGSGVAHDVETYSADFDSYLGKTVTVSGQYSGNTLFVSEISE